MPAAPRIGQGVSWLMHKHKNRFNAILHIFCAATVPISGHHRSETFKIAIEQTIKY
jgi:hypothetical protein